MTFSSFVMGEQTFESFYIRHSAMPRAIMTCLWFIDTNGNITFSFRLLHFGLNIINCYL